MTSEETETLTALDRLLGMTDTEDWRMLHQTVREDVASGKYGKDFEKQYANLVDVKLAERQEMEE